MKLRNRVWLTIMGAVALGLLLTAYLNWPRHVIYLRPSPNATKLSSVPEVGYHELWIHADIFTWSDSKGLNRWLLPLADGGLVYVEEYNAYFLDSGGHDRKQKVEGPPDLSGTYGALRGPDSGIFVCENRIVHKLSPEGAELAKAALATQDSWYVQILVKPDGGMYAIGERDVWLLGEQCEVQAHFTHSAPLRTLSAALQMPDGSFVIAGNRRGRLGNATFVSRFDAEGATVWDCRPGLKDFQVMPPVLDTLKRSEDGSLYFMGGNGLARIDAEGKRLWTLRTPGPNHNAFNEFTLTRDGMLLWSGRQLVLLNDQALSVAEPLELGADCSVPWQVTRNIFVAADGTIYIQAQVPGENRPASESNSILALDSSGKPLWRIQLGTDRFDLLGTGLNGEFYGLRRGETIIAGKGGGSGHCEIVCLLPETR